MSDIGKAYFQLMPSAKGIKGNILKEINPDLQGAGQEGGGSFGSSMIGKIKDIIAVAGIGKLIASSISEGGKLQQSLGGIETLFKGSADKVKEYARKSFSTTGLSANEYMENVTSFSASLISSLGGDTKKAAELANIAMVDMSDNANKMGTDMEAITGTYQSLARGNYAMLDNLKLGYGKQSTLPYKKWVNCFINRCGRMPANGGHLRTIVYGNPVLSLIFMNKESVTTRG